MSLSVRTALLSLLLTLASAVDCQVNFHAVLPAEPAIPVTDRMRLQVGTLTYRVDDTVAMQVAAAGSWGFAVLRPVWKRDAFNRYVDSAGMPTSDATQFVVDHYEIPKVYCSVPNGSGGWANISICDEDVPALRNTQVFTPSAALVGEVYWYEGTTVRVIDIRHGTAFLTADAAAVFNRRTLLDPTYGMARQKMNPANGGDFGLMPTPTRSLSSGSFRGGQFATVVGVTGYLFNGATLLVDGSDNPDPYRLEGVSRVIRNAVVIAATNTVAWPQLESERTVQYAGRITDQRPPGELAEPAYSQWMAAQALPAVTITVVDRAANRTTIDDQNVGSLHDAVASGRAGDASDKQNAQQVAETLRTGNEYLKIDENGNLVATAADNYSDPALASLSSSVGAGLINGLVVDGQASINDFNQATPVAQPLPAAEATSIHAAVSQVEAKMYQQEPTSLPLRGAIPPRYAEMNPAGYTPSYLIGPLTAYGDNPETPFPDGNPFGQAEYDLDGDGDIDRMYSSDPYLNGFDQIVLKWDVDAGGFRYGEYDDVIDKNAFAIYGQNHAKPDQRKLLFAGYDGTIWTSSQNRWNGVTFHDFALSSLFEMTGTPNVFRFALTYQGTAVIADTATPPPTPTVSTVSWTTKQDVITPDGNVVKVTTEEGTETVYLYANVLDPGELATSTFSVANFTPRATIGRPTQVAKYVRTVIPSTINGTIGVPGAPVTTVVYFPSDFNEQLLVEPPLPVYPGVENSFRWNYHNAGDGRPFNYQRGKNFPRGFFGVKLNTPNVLAHFGGDLPLMSADDIVAAGGIEMFLRESAVPNPTLDVNPTVQEQLFEAWKGFRSMIHEPFDPRTDRSAGGGLNRHGVRTYDIVGGAGYYLYKGKWIPVASLQQQRDLIRKMWDWDLFQPPTIYTQLHIDNDRTKPLLNTARAPTSLDAVALYKPVNGILSNDISLGGLGMNENAKRRSDLSQASTFIFSGAHGREHEIEMALSTPKNCRLYCVEWDDYNAVQRQFPGYDLTFVTNDEEERKLKASIITQILGRTDLATRLAGGEAGGSTMVTGDASLLALAAGTPGKAIFTDKNLLYGKPCVQMDLVAVLPDGEYGNPASDSWYSNVKVQFRHPMAVFYDDRWSSVTVAYGSNADPRKWCEKWNDYALPVSGNPIDQCKRNFEAWADDAKLTTLYDRMNASEYAIASQGNLTLPPPPTQVNPPVAPLPPPPWTEGPIVYPAIVADPGPRPQTPGDPVWTRARSGWGSSGGTVNSALDPLSWSNAYSLSIGLQSGHDQWLTQFAQPQMTVNQITPTTLSKFGSTSTYAYVFGAFIKPLNGVIVGSYPELTGAFAPSSPWLYVFKARTTCTIVFNLPVACTVDLTAFSFDDTQVYIDNVFTDRFDGDTYKGHIVDHSYRYNLGAGQHSIRLTTDGNNSGYGVRGALVRTVSYYALAKSIADADLAAYQTFQGNDNAWNAKNDKYQIYLRDLALAQAKQARYNAYLVSRDAAMVRYREELVQYELQSQLYKAYQVALAAWNAMKQELQPKIDRWAAYVSSRTAWVFLITGRIREPGTNWISGEPTWDAFTFWRSQPECTCP